MNKPELIGVYKDNGEGKKILWKPKTSPFYNIFNDTISEAIVDYHKYDEFNKDWAEMCETVNKRQMPSESRI